VSPTKRETAADPTTEGGGDLSGRLAADLAALDRELTEIDMLVAQASTEAGRHEQKRSQAADKLAAGENLSAGDLAALNAQLVALTRRAAVMEAQVEVLEGKRKTLGRYRDTLAGLQAEYGDAVPVPGDPSGGSARTGGSGTDAGAATSPMSRIVLNAQEDLRREIARAMHDGPAQSLTNIVLQAQIVERLLGRDLTRARSELQQLMAMVQHTLEATKTFIFEVRPMVLDDLGLVPTLRRAARERGRKAGVAVDMESIGQDRRLEVDLESSLFRIIDEALTSYLSARPDHVSIRLDWLDDQLEARVSATRDATKAMDEADRAVAEVAERSQGQSNLPPALESMMADRRQQAEDSATAAREAAIVALPGSTWREIEQRAMATGIRAELVDAGGTLLLRADVGALADASNPAS
jgi:two-component system, NarL family, sensor histidine kinase DegS